MDANSVFVLVENVRSLFNVGALFRTADAAGVTKIYLTGFTGTPPHREIRKVALGAEESVPWEYCAEAAEVIARLRRKQVQIVVLESCEQAVAYDRAPYRFPLCLVVGHEFNGVSAATLQAADLVVRIPMYGAKTSLNVGVAFGIAVYEVIKRRNSHTGRR